MKKVVQKLEAWKPRIPKLLKVAAYARVSSGKDEMLHSLSAQVSYYSKLIQSHRDWAYAGVYADSAVTGTKEARAEFQRMLEDCRNGKIDMIITKSITRFARNTVVLLSVVRELKDLGVDVWFEKENIHSNSGDGELMITILASFAQEESLSVSENCKWRIQNDFKQGIPTGTTVYGYFAKNRQLTVNETEAVIVRRIFDMYINGMGSECIAAALNKDNIPSPSGRQWQHRAILDILRNEKYIGDLMLQKYYTTDHITKQTKKNDGRLKKYYVTDNHEPIIDREQFETVKKMIEDKEKKNPHIKPYEYDFKHMVFCENCGCKYYRKKTHTGTASEHFVWKCKTYTYKGKKYCDSKQIPDEVLTKLADGFDKEIAKIIICRDNMVKFIFADSSEETRSWEIDRTWSDEMKARNYENLRRRYQ
ncbi:MAG: recombinase family protein [Candidatus Ornithomonoglobus sp.]